jgi:hypothetical protein
VRRAIGIGVPVLFFVSVGAFLWTSDSRAPSAADRAIVRANLLGALPVDARRLGARFGDAIELAGADQESTRAMAGEETKVTLYWRCLARPRGDLRIFAHLEGPDGSRANLDHDPVYGLHPISEWRPGTIVRDELWIGFAGDAAPGEHVLWVGVYDEDPPGDRVPVVAADDAIVDADDRARAAGWRLADAPDTLGR